MTRPETERAAIALFEEMLEQPEAERDAWLQAAAADRSELLARIQAMRSADRLAQLRTGGATDDLEEVPPPERIGAYRIAERIGRGGMGSVYRADRATGDFTHVVAIKIIKPGLLAESLIERFQRERQTLAQLSHPNIAQLYDGGEIAGGSPYIVMEYVDGSPLLDWADGRGVDRPGRQRLFQDICGAVAAAHRNLIVHRDLTPSNVLVTREGVVKLIDFGIARPAEEDDGRGLTSGSGSIASLSLTPGYAAPERMTGAPVTTAADIYSLGKLLEKLLPPAPSDAELRAIIACATKADPTTRYPSADALGRDVAAWTRSEPVVAMAGGRRYRAAKFLARHRLSVFASAVALLFLIGASVRAEYARADAERRFAETRAIAKTLLFESYDAVSLVPGSTEARAMLAQRGLTYLDALAADTSAPLDVKVETGLGYLRLAQVTGGGSSSQQGKFESANTLLVKADAILTPLHAADPADPTVAVALGKLRLEQSAVDLYNNNDPTKARRGAREAQALLREAARTSLAAAAARTSAIVAEGDALIWIDDFVSARQQLLRARAFVETLPLGARNALPMLRVRATNARLLGEALHKLKQVEPARLALDQGVTIAREMVHRMPTDPALRRQLANQLRYRAVVHRTNGRGAEARASAVEAYGHTLWLRDRDSNDAGALQLFALVAELRAQTLADAGSYVESKAMSNQVIAALTRLVGLSGQTPGARRSLATAYATRGGDLYGAGDYAGACASWEAGARLFMDLERQSELSKTDRDNGLPEIRSLIAKGCSPPRSMGPI